MLKVGLLGFGFMGRMHFDNYVRLMEEGAGVQLQAICDVRMDELKNAKASGNMATEKEVYDLSDYRLYSRLEDMLEQEQLDIVDVCLQTYLHADLTCMLLEKGYHVLCEKPVAGSSDEGWRMVQAAKRSGKQLMIGQCLRFWPEYEYLKACVEDGRYGKALAGQFYRGSESPTGWFLDGDLSGGCILDMHIHDADMIHWLFGKPDAVTTQALNVIPGSGYDIVSTHYSYPDGKVIHGHADWTLQGEHGFFMGYRVNFERATLVFDQNVLTVYPAEAPRFQPDLSTDAGYYREIKYFLNCVANGESTTVCTPDSAVGSLEIIEAEIRSAKENGRAVTVANNRYTKS